MSKQSRAFKVLRSFELLQLIDLKIFHGSEDDARDGFIHLSTHEQLAGTLDRHFAGEDGLYIVECGTDSLSDALRWEPSRSGALFPHLYRELRISDVACIYPREAFPPQSEI